MNKKKSFMLAIVFELVIFFSIILFMKVESILFSIIIILIFTAVIILILRRAETINKIKTIYEIHNKEMLWFLLILILVLPFFFKSNIYIIHIITLALIYSIAALGLNFQTGSTGMVNFAQGALMGIGAYASALLVVNIGMNFWIGLAAGIIIAGFFGFILGIPTLKTKEYHLSLVTIAFAYVSYFLILNMQWTGGPDGIAGIPKPSIFGFSLAKSLTVLGFTIPGQIFYFYLVAIILIIAIIFAWRIHNSWLGLTWNAIRDDEIASRCYGIYLTPYKLLAFILGSMYAGAAGVLYAHFVGFISPDLLAFSGSLLLLSMVILGGMDNILGVLIGAILLIIIPEKFRAFHDFRLMFYGLILLLMLLFRPQGLFPKRARNYNLNKGVE
ncbi:MAG: branched-chain amino acid ABC transporter permease [Spirochaetes bacterium]|nr:MAG: branched-chain amino acid ABC transporter permease [Spirochaetota bacterium]